MIDLQRTEYRREELAWGVREGLWKKGTDIRHGPFRDISDGVVFEYTVKDDVYHGLDV